MDWPAQDGQRSAVAERFGLGRAVTYSRLSGLVELGLLEHQRIFHAAPGVYMATGEGLAVVGTELPAARIDLRSYDHDLELTSLVVTLEREFGAHSVTTEREMRAIDAPAASTPPDSPRFAVPLTGARGQLQLTPLGNPRLHFADCSIALDSGRGLAVELERTPRELPGLRRILSGYIACRNVEGVRYYARGDRVRALVENEVEHLSARTFIEVHDWPESDRASRRNARPSTR